MELQETVKDAYNSKIEIIHVLYKFSILVPETLFLFS